MDEILNLDEDFMVVGPNWPFDRRFDQIVEFADEALAKAREREAELLQDAQAAEDRFGADAYDFGDEFSELMDFTDSVQHGFFVTAVAYFERQARGLAKSLDPSRSYRNLNGAVTALASHESTTTSEVDINRLDDLRQLRNEIAHGGGEVTDLFDEQCARLIASGEVRATPWGTIHFTDGFLHRAILDLRAMYVAWADATRAWRAVQKNEG